MNKKRSGPVILANEDNWSWGTDPKTHRLFVFLLQNATPVARPYRDAILRRGDVYATVLQLAEETGLSAREVRTALSHMLISGDIESIRYGRNRVIHITRYDWYVSPSDQEEQHLPESVHSVDSHNPADANADSGDPDDVTPALALMIKSDAWKTQNGRFIPYPANWLNDRRWEDDPAEADRRFISNSVLPIQSYRQRDYSEQIESDEEMFERLKRGCGIRTA